jgi:Zn-dependent peptidase ImmA (M78 family)
MSGLIHRRPDGAVVIGINANHAVTRQRFSIAHELGHLVLHQSEAFHIDERFPMDFRDERASQGTDEREIEANQFAAELLMPEVMLKTAIRKLPTTVDGDDAVDILAEQFGVSAKAMAIRLSALKILTV